MKNFLICKSKIQGRVFPPPSKSETMRALIFAALSCGTSTIMDPLFSTDVDAMLKAIQLIGAKVKQKENKLFIEGNFGIIPNVKQVIDAKNSGLIFRFVSAVLTSKSDPTTISADSSFKRRRYLKPLITGISSLGGRALRIKKGSNIPLIISGPLTKNYVKIDGEDSQNVSALLIAAAIRKEKIVTEIEVFNPQEKPYIDMTLEWLKKLNIPFERKGYNLFKVEAKGSWQSFSYKVLKDHTQAAYLATAALLTGGELVIEDLDLVKAGVDIAWVSIFKSLKVNIETTNHEIKIKKTNKIQGGIIDINDTIDTLPLFALIGTQASEPLLIRNASIARHKESNRIQTIQKELSKMGAKILEKKDGLLVFPSKLIAAKVFSHLDHRIAFTLTIAGMLIKEKTFVQDVDCTKKSYVDFFKDLKNLGANIEI